ncbi:aldo/keto reductase [Melittangium boletus DSM 14713]|uniref:Aldo/keto reductase n=2 Tax=Melittangium boletus TaxID=83453 RepID=A0A250I6W8_9BACT|nr:aldo/keto reductase [Melittangium boletus DSM 14713]
MHLGGEWNTSPPTGEHVKRAHEVVDAALSLGINLFDHADIYTMGKSEQVFGQVLKERPGLRERILLQSKCGIRFADESAPGRYDFSQAHIEGSVDGILSRLGVEFLDLLLLHRPDPLMEPEEVAASFRRLKASGKVRHFGVSNMSAGQLKLLRAFCDEPLVVNQLEMSLEKIDWLDTGVHVNQAAGARSGFPEGTLEHCRLEHIQIQAWGPLAQGLYSGRSLEGQPESVRNTAALVGRLAEAKQTTREAIVLAWLMKHPAAIQPVIGSTDPRRIAACADAERIQLTREEWFSLYVSSRGARLP